jgi:hypothetical protein
MRTLPALLCCITATIASACSVPPSNATISIDGPSESATEWYPVADYLGHRCGDLDCHGNPQRNFIVYSCDGLRYAAGDIPGCKLGPNAPATTPEEYEATYRSLVGLEPVVMAEVVEGGGQDPELLTFVRKAEGLENHKGGTLIQLGTTAGMVQDVCITSWLAGDTNIGDCNAAATITQ